jgi:hypothetical protein
MMKEVTRRAGLLGRRWKKPRCSQYSTRVHSSQPASKQAEEGRELEGPGGAPGAGGDQRDIDDVRRGRVGADEALEAAAVEEARRPGLQVGRGLGAEGGGEQLVGEDGVLRHKRVTARRSLDQAGGG